MQEHFDKIVAWFEMVDWADGAQLWLAGAFVVALLVFFFALPRRRNATVAPMGEPALPKTTGGSATSIAPKVSSLAPTPRAVSSPPRLSLPPDEGDPDAEFDPTMVGRRARLSASSLPTVPVYIDGHGGTVPGTCLVLEAAFRMSRGLRRERHEDAFVMLRDTFVVADGVGGHAGGAEASRTAVKAFEDVLQNGPQPEVDMPAYVPQAARLLVGAVVGAHQAVHTRAQNDVSLQEMGTTLLAFRADVAAHQFMIAHVGDTRCYRLRKRELTQLTEDHVSMERDNNNRLKKVLSRALGVADRVEVALSIGRLEKGDLYLLCTDGLYNEVTQLRELLLDHGDLPATAGRLIGAAEAHGGRDNISLVLVSIKGSGE